MVIPWKEIELAVVAGLPVPDAATQFGVKQNTIRKRAIRYQWPTPSAVVKRVRELTPRPSGQAIETMAQSWIERGEEHRETAFDVASKSLKKMKPTKPKNWKEAEIVDKMARRAAGLENAEIVQQSLIQINEAMDASEQPIEASVVPELLSPPSSEAGQ